MTMTVERTFTESYAAARAGDASARETLVAMCRERLQAFIARRMGAQVRRRVEPEDIFQSTVLSLFDRMDTFPDDLTEEEFRAYVFQIAKWRIADVLKGRDQGESVVPAGREPEEVHPSSGPVTRQDERRWTREQIARLPETYADVLDRFYVRGEPMSVIADALGITVNLVKQRLHRGREQLKGRLVQPEEGDDRR